MNLPERIEAGRACDERIAVEVMEAFWFEPPGVSPDGWRWLVPPGWAYSTGQPAWATRAGNSDKLASAHCLPRYSTDRSAALEVVDRLTEAGLSVSMSNTDDGRWLMEIHDLSLDVDVFQFAPTLPLAICRAALAPEVLEYLASVSRGEEP